MKLEAVCLGKTATINIRGHDVKTAYRKSPVDTPVDITRDGLAGNEVAVHLDAIYAIAAENYGYWSKELGVDPEGWPPGTFAENLTISGLPESELQVGDTFAIGPDVVLTVAGPRIPCFKLCWCLEQPDSFIPTFAMSGRSGAYFNVETPGTVQTGDDVRLVKRAADGVKILDIARYLFGHPASEDELRTVMAQPGLSKSALFALQSKVLYARDQERVRRNRWSGWRDVRVRDVVDETPLIKSFSLISADGEPLAPFKAGQFLTFNLPLDGKATTRVWSLSDYQEYPEHYRVSIKKSADGHGSGFMHGSVQPDTMLQIAAPLGHFSVDRGGFKPLLLIAAGIGITPLLAMLKAHVGRDDDRPPAYLIHCNKNGVLQPFRQELDALAEHEGVSTLHVFSTPTDDDERDGAYDVRGRLTRQSISAFVADAHIMDGDLRVDMPIFEFDTYLCGPSSFQDAVVADLVEIGVNRHQIYQESFAAAEGESQTGVVHEAEVEFSPFDVTAQWRLDDNLTLLELAEASGLELPNACRMGVCQSCSRTLLEGAVYYEQRPTHHPGEDQVLLCCARPASRRVAVGE